VDTKYEFGKVGDDLYVIDEIHTPDSSRYWVADEYEARFAKGEDQRMLDKENIRQWLIRERNFQGHGTPPVIPSAAAPRARGARRPWSSPAPSSCSRTVLPGSAVPSIHIRQDPPPASTPHAGEHVEVQRPP
jgi:hypothetical protein